MQGCNLTAGTQQLSYQFYASALARYDRVIVFSQLQAEVLIRLGVLADRLVASSTVWTDRWAPTRHTGDALLLQRVRQRLGSERTFLYMGRPPREERAATCLAPVSPQDADCDRRRRPLPAQNSFSESGILWWGYEADLNTRIALMQCAEVFVLPSLVEGLSLALLEAMAAARPARHRRLCDGEVLAKARIVLSTQGGHNSLCCRCCAINRCSPRNSVDGHGSGRLRDTP